jgi:alkylhydroperoxidase family enzyme
MPDARARRVPYRDPDENQSSIELRAIVAEISGLRGRILNIHRALANEPSALKAFMSMSRYIRDESSLPPSLRELVILTVAAELGSTYEKVQHTPIARQLGVPDIKLNAVERRDEALVAFTVSERVAVLFAASLARGEEAPDSVLAELHQVLSVSQVVDLALTVGWYRLCDAVIRGLDVTPELPYG